MSCPFESNPFCAGIPVEIRPKMCAACSFVKFSKGQLLTVNYWNSRFAVLVDGLLVAGYQEENEDKLFVTGMCSAGAIIGNSRAFKNIPVEMTDRIVNCITKCTVAVFDGDYVYDLCQRYKETKLGMYILFSSFETYWFEKEAMIRAINGKDAYQAVKYVVSYCNKRKIPPLTHEQIAMICNRARPTVTKLLAQLTRNEPELFSYWSTV